MSTTITLKNIEIILAFLTLFSDKEAKLYNIQIEPLTLNPYCYSKEFDSFITSVYQENFVIDFDWPAWQNEAHRFVTDPELLTLADISTLQKLFTTHLRKERFCSGHLAGMIENGHFLAIFNRLQAIHAALIVENAHNNGRPKMIKQTSVFQGDITQLQVDAIVNAAKNSLLGGGGVDGTIHRAAGPELLAECRQLHGCPTGEAKITKGYKLPAKWVIHTVGPIWYGGNQGEDEMLARCYRNSLALAEQYQIKSIAFPAISTGVYGFPLERASRIAIAEVNKFLHSHKSPEQVIFVCFGQSAYDCYLKVVQELAES
ncbi:O-acetyl-ADP-ribose deacetylase [Nostoc sp. 106C]|uniref:O-acetyl-ADP-ribose deacetylase n=1 Tax=Nostoc sp. 106C TaxID=1932667 RepID=UPI001AA13453|nr:O-acetyl-ADP-ribose deacetylase [Nostoc sp. 106C]